MKYYHHSLNGHPHCFGVSNWGILSGGTIGGSIVVNSWGIDIPPEITISAAH